MTTQRPEKQFDCAEMQHEAGRATMEALRGMTLEEQLAFWAEKTEEMRRHQEEQRRLASASGR